MLQVSSSSSSSSGLLISNAPTSKIPPVPLGAYPACATSTASKSFVVFAKYGGEKTMKLQDGAPNIHRSSLLRLLSAAAVGIVVNSPAGLALAEENEDYVKETTEVISKVRTTIGMDKSNPNVATAVAELREASNAWVAKYRREKALLGRASFRDVYSALNAVSGHYISFGPTAPIPAKRKMRILEEVDTAEKALLRGR